MTVLGPERGRLFLHRDRRPPAGQGLGISGSPGVPAVHAFTREACPLLSPLPPLPSRLTSTSNRPGHKINKHLLFIRKIIKLQKKTLKNQA